MRIFIENGFHCNLNPKKIEVKEKVNEIRECKKKYDFPLEKGEAATIHVDKDGNNKKPFWVMYRKRAGKYLVTIFDPNDPDIIMNTIEKNGYVFYHIKSGRPNWNVEISILNNFFPHLLPGSGNVTVGDDNQRPPQFP